MGSSTQLLPTCTVKDDNLVFRERLWFSRDNCGNSLPARFSTIHGSSSWFGTLSFSVWTFLGLRNWNWNCVSLYCDSPKKNGMLRVSQRALLRQLWNLVENSSIRRQRDINVIYVVLQVLVHHYVDVTYMHLWFWPSSTLFQHQLNVWLMKLLTT